MRRYKVEITHDGRIVYSREVIAGTSGEAMDDAWQAFDPDHRIGLLDAYDTTVREIRVARAS